ncbi:unnamed protein product [Blepharisma stoltei]|uniref:Uncharacterized protein n=1 Tax=Blepharisma stoltei TaxID=1481888 RepID=A0AAU9K4U8_9CILI|nr:unnamed protein product [Blepharisma stoltei]
MNQKFKQLSLKIKNWANNTFDVKALRTSFHYWALLGVSIFVFYQMEAQMSAFKRHTTSSMTEREYEQEQAYKTLMTQIKAYDGQGVPLEKLSEEEFTYKYDIADKDN